MCRGDSGCCASIKWKSPEKGVRTLDFSQWSAEGRWVPTEQGVNRTTIARRKLWLNNRIHKKRQTAPKNMSKAQQTISRPRQARKRMRSGGPPSKRQKSFVTLAEGKAREFRGAAETAWTDAQSKAKTWQADSETYIRENPTRAILVALGLGFLLGLLFRK